MVLIIPTLKVPGVTDRHLTAGCLKPSSSLPVATYWVIVSTQTPPPVDVWKPQTYSSASQQTTDCGWQGAFWSASVLFGWYFTASCKNVPWKKKWLCLAWHQHRRRCWFSSMQGKHLAVCWRLCSSALTPGIPLQGLCQATSPSKPLLEAPPLSLSLSLSSTVS